MNLGQFSAGLAVKLFFVGMTAISAMFLPGISGSTLLLILSADGIHDFLYDGWFFLCDHTGAGYIGDTEGGNEFRKEK